MTTIAPTIDVVSELDGYSALLNVGGHVITFETWWDDDELDAIIARDVHLDNATMAAAARVFVEGPFATRWATDYRDALYGGLLPEAEEVWDIPEIGRLWGRWVTLDGTPIGDGDQVPEQQRWEELTAPVDGAEMYTQIRFDR